MRRWGIRILICLLLGAVINIAVAWGCSLFASDRYDGGLYWPENEAGYVRAKVSFGSLELSQFGQGMTVSLLRYGTTIRGDQFRAMLPSASAFTDNAVVAGWDVFLYRECFAGWPMYSVYGSCASMHSDETVNRGLLDNIPDLTRSSTRRTELPYATLWPGFAINTVFYAAILLGLWMTPGMIRRIVRAKRGRCAGCGYDLRGTPGKCPECGAAAS